MGSEMCIRDSPNTLEPWTPRMYACLRDGSAMVRSNTVTVLTHLILNDMIKVKGQISDMALCIMDEHEKISNMAKLFFTELSRKGNALYNVMPDIVSRLRFVFKLKSSLNRIQIEFESNWNRIRIEFESD